MVLKPTTDSCENLSLVTYADLIPLKNNKKYIIIKPTANIMPNSSHIAAYIKSESFTGIYSTYPCPSPLPTSPPEEIAYKDCTNWYPASEAYSHGFLQIITLSLTWAKRLYPNMAPAVAPPKLNATYSFLEVAT